MQSDVNPVTFTISARGKTAAQPILRFLALNFASVRSARWTACSALSSAARCTAAGCL